MYDAIVVGARCGGSAAAMLLARQGHSVLVVDRASFPSDTWSTHFAALTKGPLLGHRITDAFMSAALASEAIHPGFADGDLDAALARYDDAVWELLRPMYEASRDAAADFDKSGDELFAAIAPAQMISAANADMVAAGGPTL